MNIGKAKEDTRMFLSIPVSLENSKYFEKISDELGLTFEQLMEKMIDEHKIGGFTHAEGSSEEGEEESSIKKTKNKKNINSK